MNKTEELEYAGFWIRVGASIIDSILIAFLTLPLLIAIYGMDYFESGRLIEGTWDFIISFVLPAVAVIAFWVYRSATPGKMVVGAKIVDEKTGEKLSTGQCVARYLGYIVSALPLGLGFIWVAFDKRKQGWHDMIADTVVVRKKHEGTEPVSFEQ